jgi:hypothetical protein
MTAIVCRMQPSAGRRDGCQARPIAAEGSDVEPVRFCPIILVSSPSLRAKEGHTGVDALPSFVPLEQGSLSREDLV